MQCTNIVDDGLKVCVVDIGRINPFAFETATVHHEEDRQKRIRGYRTALESLATAIKKTCQLDKFVEYCRKLADQFMTVCYHRRTIKIRERERDQRELGRLVNYICGDGVNVVFVGMRNVNAAKGYAMVPTKKFIRRCGNVCCTVRNNQFGTSSRSPVCRDKTKVTQVKREKKDRVTTSQRYNREDIVSESANDGRMEQCSTCENDWEHDKVSTVNMLHIAKNMLCGIARPVWLMM